LATVFLVVVFAAGFAAAALRAGAFFAADFAAVFAAAFGAVLIEALAARAGAFVLAAALTFVTAFAIYNLHLSQARIISSSRKTCASSFVLLIAEDKRHGSISMFLSAVLLQITIFRSKAAC
jgi:hypothetical protein